MKLALYMAFSNESTIKCCKEIIGLVSDENSLIIDSKLKKELSIERQNEFDIARFDQQFAQLQGQTKVAALKSGVALEGTALKILRSNAEQAEIQKDIMEYNSKVAQSQALEQANFARMQGNIARQEGKIAAIGYYGQAAATVAPYGESLLGGQSTSPNQYTQANLSFARSR